MTTPAASMPKRSEPISVRLEAASIPVTECGCWIWTGALSAGRYGLLKIDGHPITAHRASWIAYRGDIPDGLHVLHKCDNTFCINPDHLFLGTHSNNMADKERKGRGNHATGLRNGRHTNPASTPRGDNHYSRKTPGIRKGELNGHAKLTESDVRAIRLNAGSSRTIAQQFGITKTTVLKIKRRKLWGHL